MQLLMRKHWKYIVAISIIGFPILTATVFKDKNTHTYIKSIGATRLGCQAAKCTVKDIGIRHDSPVVIHVRHAIDRSIQIT